MNFRNPQVLLLCLIFHMGSREVGSSSTAANALRNYEGFRDRSIIDTSIGVRGCRQLSRQTFYNVYYRNGKGDKYSEMTILEIEAFVREVANLPDNIFEAVCGDLEGVDVYEPSGDVLSHQTMISWEGVYIHEGNALTETLVANMTVGAHASGALSVRLSERVYRRRWRRFEPRYEQGSAFQKRIEYGNCDSEIICIGWIFRDGDGLSASLKNTHREEGDVHSLRGAVSFLGEVPSSRMTIQMFEDGVLRSFQNYIQGFGSRAAAPPNLTKRYVNNIIIRERYINYNKFTRSTMRLRTLEHSAPPLREVDEKLLEAALAGDSVGMVEAIVEGADVNAQDRETGSTALHNAAKSLSPVAVSVLTRPNRMMREHFEGVLDYMQESYEGFDRTGVDTVVRAAGQELNPLIVDRGYRFASAELGIGFTWETQPTGPTAPLKEDIWQALVAIEERGLQSIGQLPVLNFMKPDIVRAAVDQAARGPGGSDLTNG